MRDLEVWQQIALIAGMLILLLSCCAVLICAMLGPVEEFNKDIEFKPLARVEVKHARDNGTS